MATTFPFQAIRVANPMELCRGLIPYPEAASETFLKGAILESELGYATKWDVVGQILGVAVTAGRNAASAGLYDTLVAPAFNGGLEFYASVEDAIALANLGESYALKLDAGTGHFVIDTGLTGHCFITELTGLKPNPFHATAAVGDIGVVVKFVFDASASFGA